jgi:hypothetical protein
MQDARLRGGGRTMAVGEEWLADERISLLSRLTAAATDRRLLVRTAQTARAACVAIAAGCRDRLRPGPLRGFPVQRISRS